MAGFALAKYRFRGDRLAFTLIMATLNGLFVQYLVEQENTEHAQELLTRLKRAVRAHLYQPPPHEDRSVPAVAELHPRGVPAQRAGS